GRGRLTGWGGGDAGNPPTCEKSRTWYGGPVCAGPEAPPGGVRTEAWTMKLSALPLLAAAVLAAATRAQPDPFVRPLPPAAAGTEALGRFLHELGYAPKALSPDVYQVTVDRDRWPVHVMLSL